MDARNGLDLRRLITALWLNVGLARCVRQARHRFWLLGGQVGPVQAGVGAAVRAATARLLGMRLQLPLIAASLRFTVALLNTAKMRESLH